MEKTESVIKEFENLISKVDCREIVVKLGADEFDAIKKELDEHDGFAIYGKATNIEELNETIAGSINYVVNGCKLIILKQWNQ